MITARSLIQEAVDTIKPPAWLTSLCATHHGKMNPVTADPFTCTFADQKDADRFCDALTHKVGSGSRALPIHSSTRGVWLVHIPFSAVQDR